MLLSRDAILQTNDLPTELVHVPEWGGDVYVRAMSGAERDAFEVAVVSNPGKHQTLNLANIRARLVATTVVDQQGVRLFTDADVAALGGKSAAALDRVVEVAQRLSAVSDGDVEQLAKNSVSGQSDDSGSASH
jgi:hypothetical protein